MPAPVILVPWMLRRVRRFSSAISFKPASVIRVSLSAELSGF